MLWQKETKKNGGIYVDVFALNGGQILINEVFRPFRSSTSSTLNKNDAVSLQNRLEGNNCFSKSNWIDAMELYNASLRYAEKGSQCMSLAYANRSVVFLKLKRYNECLVDIQLAKNAGYPAESMSKLDQRQAQCLKDIKSDATPIAFKPKLDFGPDKNFPCMANVLEIHRSGDEFTVIAKEDIDVGKTIVVEKAFMAYVFMRYGWKCNVCLKEHANLMPCEKCTSAMFCSDECENDSIHKYECGRRFSNDSLVNGSIMRVVRSCLLAIDLFSSVDELINFVEKSLKSASNQSPSALSDEKSKYELFLKLPIGSHRTISIHVSCIVFEVYRVLLTISHVNAMFANGKSRRFLMHLIAHHFYALEHNAINLCGRINDGSLFKQKEPIFISSQIGLMSRYFKHSCAPNIFVSTFNGNNVISTVRPIKKGVQLVRSFLMLMSENTENRQKALWQRKRFICTCSLCNGVSESPALRQQLAFDPNFQYIVSNFNVREQNAQALQTLIEKCKCFLKKYGHIFWCDELGKVVQIYIFLMNIRYRGVVRLDSVAHKD